MIISNLMSSKLYCIEDRSVPLSEHAVEVIHPRIYIDAPYECAMAGIVETQELFVLGS